MQLSVLRILQMLVKSDIGSEAEIVVVQINHLLIRVNSKVFLLLCIFTLLLRTLGLGSCICIGLFQTVTWSQVGVSFVWRWGVNRIGYKSLWASHKFLGWCSANSYYSSLAIPFSTTILLTAPSLDDQPFDSCGSAACPAGQQFAEYRKQTRLVGSFQWQ